MAGDRRCTSANATPNDIDRWPETFLHDPGNSPKVPLFQQRLVAANCSVIGALASALVTLGRSGTAMIHLNTAIAADRIFDYLGLQYEEEARFRAAITA